MKKVLNTYKTIFLLIFLINFCIACDLFPNNQNVNIESIEIKGPDLIVLNKDTSYYVSIYPSNAKNTGVTWDINNPNTIGATISKSGVFKATSPGSVIISATIGNISGTKEITVKFDGEIINTADELNAIRNNLNGKYQLGSNIDLIEYSNWVPIGTQAHPFNGQLDGNGYTISNLNINTLDVGGAGFFGNLNDKAYIYNLKVIANISAVNAGIIAGNSKGSITYCEVSGSVGRNNGDYIGGIVGKQTGGNISNNTNNASVTGSNYIGGIVGYANIQKIENCTNNSEISSNSNNVGGIAGGLHFNNNYSVLSCINNSSINGKGSVGGIVGEITLYTGSMGSNYKSNIQMCFNNSKIQGNSDCIGGIVGNIISTGSTYGIHKITLDACENKGDIMGLNYVGGYVGFGLFTSFNGLINNNSITGGAYVGGIAGRGDDFINCENNGEINATGVVVENGNVYAYVGGIAGYSGSIDGCKNSISILYSKNASYVGGIVGYANLSNQTVSKVNNCSNYGDIISSGNSVGGIAGNVYFRNNNTVSSCENFGVIQGNDNVGGIIGRISTYKLGSTNTSNSSIQMCVNNGSVTSLGDYAGGIFGCYNTGVSGYSTHYINITSCENNSNIKGLNYIGGFAGCGEYTNFSGLINTRTIEGGAYIGGITGKGHYFENCENKGIIIANGTVTENSITNAYVGGIAGYVIESIINCKNEANITYTRIANYVGGVVGYSGSINMYSRNKEIVNCFNSGNIISDGNSVGGIVGGIYFGSNTVISGCINLGSIQGRENVGGIVGMSTTYNPGIGNSTKSSIQMCINNGVVNSFGNNTGGIVGYISGNSRHTITFASCENSANVNGLTNSLTGGILGSNNSSAITSTDCTNTGVINNEKGHALVP